LCSLPHEDLAHVLEHTKRLWDDVRGQAIFLTGGTGFVGRWLLESLLRANDTLGLNITVVALTRNPERFRAECPQLAGHPAVQLVSGNTVSFDFPDGVFPYVIHAAVEPGFTPDAQRPLGMFEADIAGTRRVLEFAHQCGTRRFLFTSSGAVYGRQPSGIKHVSEDYAGAPSTIDTNSVYGQAKRTSEFIAAMYGRVYGFDVIVARLFAFVGPLLPLHGNYAVGNFVRDVLHGGPVRVQGDGTPYRSYLYAADLAVWLWTLLFRGDPGQAYNVGSPDDLTIADLARVVVDATAPETRIEIHCEPVPGAPPLRYVPDTRRAETELGLRPSIPVAEGVRRMWLWNRTKGFA
jgi:dTDP-glucose 4,6-dehydratase